MKSSIKELSFLCAYFSWIVFNILYASTIPLPNWSAALMKSIVLLLLLVSMLYGFKLHPNEIVRIGAVTFAVVAAAVLGKTNSLFISYAFVVAASSQDVKRVYKIALFAYLIGVITVAFLAVVGIIDNNVVARGGTSRVRSPMGFTHVNTCGAYLLMIGIMWFYNYYSEKRFKSNIVLGSLIFILVKFIDSRTATVILALVLLLCIVVEKDGVVLPKFLIIVILLWPFLV